MKEQRFFKYEMIILSMLLHKDCYGYEIATNIQKITKNVIYLREGTLYPIMIRLLKEEYVSCTEIIYHNKVRNTYHIEDKGVKHLYELVDYYFKFDNSIRKILSQNEEFNSYLNSDMS